MYFKHNFHLGLLDFRNLHHNDLIYLSADMTVKYIKAMTQNSFISWGISKTNLKLTFMHTCTCHWKQKEDTNCSFGSFLQFLHSGLGLANKQARNIWVRDQQNSLQLGLWYWAGPGLFDRSGLVFWPCALMILWHYGMKPTLDVILIQRKFANFSLRGGIRMSAWMFFQHKSWGSCCVKS